MDALQDDTEAEKAQSGDSRRPALPGRGLDRTRDAAILAAAMDGLAAVGYDRLTMEEIAARAHAGKGALYRRWPSKAALVVDAVTAWRARLEHIEIPDTGSLRGDLELIVAAVPEVSDDDRQYVALVASLATAASRDPELRAALSEHVLEHPRRALRQLLDRAVARGEIPPDRELDLVPDVLMGLNLLRMVSGQAPDRAYVRRVFDEVILPLVTGDR